MTIDVDETTCTWEGRGLDLVLVVSSAQFAMIIVTSAVAFALDSASPMITTYRKLTATSFATLASLLDLTVLTPSISNT